MSNINLVNAVRTLLLGVNGNVVLYGDEIGEQFVDPSYAAPPLPDYLSQIRSVLFSTLPDRVFFNYRLAQYMAIIHATELAEYVYALDKRVTYVDADLSDLFGPDAFTPIVTSTPGTPLLYIQGQPNPPDITGQTFYNFTVTNMADSTVLVNQTNPFQQNVSTSYNILDSVSTGTIPLGGSGYSFFLPMTPVGTTWNVTFYNRPRLDLSQILTNLKNAGGTELTQLFGVPLVEPYLTFSNLFNDNPQLPYALGGILLAVAYRTLTLITGN